MKKTILVVDDLAIFREPIEVVLRTEGYDVVTAADGVQALAAVATKQPDLILLDLSMPVLDGLVVLKTLRDNAATRSLPVIVLSAKSERAKILDASKLGISGYLLKVNFSLATMLERVRSVLDPGASAPTSAVNAANHEPIESTVASSPPPVLAVAPASKPPAKPPLPVLRKPLPGAAAIAIASTGESSTSWKARQAAFTAQLEGKSSRLVVKPGDDLKSLRPLLTRAEVVRRVNTDEELQGFSPTVAQVLKLTASSQCSMDDVSKAVSQDHAVALKILKLANSSIFSRGDRVDTLPKAVLRIGIQSIRQAVLNIGVVERFGGDGLHEELSTPLFWEHSIASGIIAAELAHALGHKDADIAFTAGLLHDLGRIIYAERLDKEYGDVIAAARMLRVPLEQAESRLLLMSHAEIMDKVLHAWHFPKELVNPIVFHHAEPDQVRSVMPRQSVEILRLSLADRLAHAMLLGSSGNDVIYPTHEHCAALNIGSDIIGKIESTAREQTDETKFALLSRSSGNESWPRFVENIRGEIGEPVRAIFIGEHAHTDAYRMFCDTISERAGMSELGPNVAVVHIASAKERDSVCRKLLEEERAAGVDPATPIPAIVLSPEARLGLDEAAARGRACRQLPTPTAHAELIDALRRFIQLDEIKRAA